MTWNEIFHIGFDSVMMIIRAMLPIYVNIEKSTIFVRVLGSWADVQPKYHSIPVHTIFTILRCSTQISFNPTPHNIHNIKIFNPNIIQSMQNLVSLV